VTSCRVTLSVKTSPPTTSTRRNSCLARDVDKIAIVHVQDGGRRDNGVHLPGLTVEGGSHKHANPHDSGILNFDPNLGRAEVGIENRADIAPPCPGTCDRDRHSG